MGYKEKKLMREAWTPERIKQLRAAFGETQDDFCDRLGVVSGTLANWEQGKGLPTSSACVLLDRIEREDLPRFLNEARAAAKAGRKRAVEAKA